MNILCTDIHGNIHDIDESRLIDRQSVYVLCIIDRTILLVQNPHSKRWELPGGGVEADETDQEALAREFTEETGMLLGGPLEFLTEWQEYFYDVISGQAWRSHRKFYRVNSVKNRDKLLISGNGDDTLAAAYLPLSDVTTANVAANIKDLVSSIDT